MRKPWSFWSFSVGLVVAGGASRDIPTWIPVLCGLLVMTALAVHDFWLWRRNHDRWDAEKLRAIELQMGIGPSVEDYVQRIAAHLRSRYGYEPHHALVVARGVVRSMVHRG